MRAHKREPHLVRAGEREIHMHRSQEPFCVEIYRKKRTWTCQKSRFENAAHDFRGPHFVWEITKTNADRHCTRAILFGNYCHTRFPGTAFVVEIHRKKTHMDIAQELCCLEIYRKNAARAGAHLDQTPGPDWGP